MERYLFFLHRAAVLAALLGTPSCVGGPAFVPPNQTKTDATSLVDEETVGCVQAYSRLPLAAWETGLAAHDLRQHVLSYRKLYLDFDKECYKNFSALQPHTRAFVSNILGAIFISDGHERKLLCSAFLISSEFAVTARHCLEQYLQDDENRGKIIFSHFLNPSNFMSISDVVFPSEEKSSLAEDNNQIGDFRDVAAMRLERSISTFSLRRGDYQSSLAERGVILLIGVNYPAYLLLLNETPERWPEAVRYSRVRGSQRFSISDLPYSPPSRRSVELCVYYTVPTYGGLSGALIMGGRIAKSPGELSRLWVAGLHLRDGATLGNMARNLDCGDYPAFNVGVLLPNELFDMAWN